MSPEIRSLPLFPLNTVLFPQATLPLQIFEERYKLMLQDCLDSDSKFGITMIKAGREVGDPAIPYTIGTVAQIVEVNEIPDGRYLISVMGQQRFRIENITQYRPYIKADVEILQDDDAERLSDEQSREVNEAVNQYNSLIMGLRGGWAKEAKLSPNPAMLSYYIGELPEIDLSEKQALLEEPSATKRLETEVEVLKRDVEALKKRVAQNLGRRFSNQ